MLSARRLRRWLGAARTGDAAPAPQVRVVPWGTGTRPRRVVVKADRPIRLVFECRDSSDVAEFVAIPALGWVTTLASTARNSVDLGPCPAGAYTFSSFDGALRGCLVVEP
jgi:plastocyanin domain-containing protein